MNFSFISTFQLCDEVDRMHPDAVNLCRRFTEGFATIVPKVVKLAQGKSPLAKIYTEVREEMLAEDLQGIILFYFSLY